MASNELGKNSDFLRGDGMGGAGHLAGHRCRLALSESMLWNCVELTHTESIRGLER